MLNEATCGQNDGRDTHNNSMATDWDISFRNNEEMKLLQPMAMNTITLPKAIIL